MKKSNSLTVCPQDTLKSIHSVVHISIAERGKGSSLPFLFLDDGELSHLALAWARHKMLHDGIGSASLGKAVAAIGRLYDFYVLEKHNITLSHGQLRLLLGQFYEARRFGLPSLGWNPVRVSTAKADARWVSEFTEWCSDNFSETMANPKEAMFIKGLRLKDQMKLKFELAARKKWDLLYHLSPARPEHQGTTLNNSLFPGKSQRAGTDVKFFPPEKIWPALLSTPSLRDKLFLLLLFFGGVRISEPLHLYATDITIQPNGVARVVLADPKEGKFEWISFSNKKRNDSRAAFLLERYDLSPRNNLAQNHPMHAGWKGMLADDGTRKESIVNWLREDAGILFGILHSEYIRTVRAHLPDGHPYYFVNEKPGVHYGQPLKLSNAAKAFNRAAIRVGLSTTLPGVNPHGARHFFGFYCASVLRLPIETTQRLMHHQSLQSTEIYYALTNETVRNELISAQKRQLLETPALLATPTHFCKLLGNRQ